MLKLEIKNKSNLYELARRAKDRLRSNNYLNIQKEKVLNSAKAFSNYVNRQKKAVINAVKKAGETSPQVDDEMYVKVCGIIENGNVGNPVLSLIDKELFESLDSEAKQFYISNLTQKYKFFRSKYYKEHLNF